MRIRQINSDPVWSISATLVPVFIKKNSYLLRWYCGLRWQDFPIGRHRHHPHPGVSGGFQVKSLDKQFLPPVQDAKHVARCPWVGSGLNPYGVKKTCCTRQEMVRIWIPLFILFWIEIRIWLYLSGNFAHSQFA